MGYVDDIFEKAKTDKIGAAVDFVKGVMRWSESGRLGYTLGNALIWAAETLDLSVRETAVVAEKVVDPLYNAAQAVLDSEYGVVSAIELEAAVAEFGYRVRAGWTA